MEQLCKWRRFRHSAPAQQQAEAAPQAALSSGRAAGVIVVPVTRKGTPKREDAEPQINLAWFMEEGRAWLCPHSRGQEFDHDGTTVQCLEAGDRSFPC